jgi:hypothetical protein
VRQAGGYRTSSSCLLTAGAPLANERISTMSDTTRLEQTEEEILTFEVSDEALETAADAGKDRGNFTLAFCSGLSTCPA